METYIGFDSAWMDNPKAPGAICAIGMEEARPLWFRPPHLVSFAEALTFIGDLHQASGVTLIALDQPTIVTNTTSMRPVERVAASLVSWMGGGVQPSNRGRTGMFCDAAPIWRFISGLGAVEDPEQARVADRGLFLMEVFPALALASIEPGSFRRLGAARYNPDRRKTFRPDDWARVAAAAAAAAASFGCQEMAGWCLRAGRIEKPRKANQDMLDAVLCVLIALRWRLRPRKESMMLGDLITGYMVLPVSKEVRERLAERAHLAAVLVDGQ